MAKKKDETIISIIIPMFNAKKYIEITINSVLNQTFKGKTEIIVIDDSSIDNSYNIVKEKFDSNVTLLKNSSNLDSERVVVET